MILLKTIRFLAVDVGMGTQDILLYESDKNVENCIKMVLPSQTRIIAQHVSRATKQRQDIVLTGTTMGGGPCTSAVRRHRAARLNVFATEKAALTLNDDLEKVRDMGVIIVGEDEAKELNAQQIEMRDIDKTALEKALHLFGLELPEEFAVAVQDHGYSPHASNRKFRFDYFRNILHNGGTLDSFVYRGTIPERFSRMKAVETLLSGALVMDTGIAAIRGALLDDHARSPSLVVNIGNGHTLACVVKERSPLAVFEHHTHQMTSQKIDDYLQRLCRGTLEFQEVFDDGGHGCYVREPIDMDTIGEILVTGPNRRMMRSSQFKVRYAAPFGDMMLTGCFGLMDAYLNNIPK